MLIFNTVHHVKRAKHNALEVLGKYSVYFQLALISKTQLAFAVSVQIFLPNHFWLKKVEVNFQKQTQKIFNLKMRNMLQNKANLIATVERYWCY